MGDAALDGTAHPVDAVVGLLGRETLQGQEDGLALLGNQVIGPAKMENHSLALLRIPALSRKPIEARLLK